MQVVHSLSYIPGAVDTGAARGMNRPAALMQLHAKSIANDSSVVVCMAVVWVETPRAVVKRRSR